MPKTSTDDRAWIAEAIRRVDADANRSAVTPLHVLPIPVPGIELYL
ncbi:MAG: cysteine synthase [Aeromicrobium sp.]|nr:cysteine synthase [Aeromicrobium sp.]